MTRDEALALGRGDPVEFKEPGGRARFGFVVSAGWRTRGGERLVTVRIRPVGIRTVYGYAPKFVGRRLMQGEFMGFEADGSDVYAPARREDSGHGRHVHVQG